MIKKTELVRQAISDGDIKRALRIAKDFRINITHEQRDKMCRAYECIVHPEFYRQIGTDIVGTINEGEQIVRNLYGGGG